MGRLAQDSRVEDVRSPLLARAQESQLTAEQPPTEKCWNLPKRILYTKRQKRDHSETVRGVQSQ